MRRLLLAAALMLACLPARADYQNDARPVTWKSCSGSATGATTISISGGPLRAFYLQNPVAATESLFFSPASAATASTTSGVSGELAPGASVSFGPGTIFSGAMTVNAVTNPHAFACLYAQ